MAQCASYDCCSSDRAHGIQNPDDVCLPQSIWAEAKHRVWHCDYCGFLWFSEFSFEGPVPINRKVAIGFYGNFTDPLRFFPDRKHRIR